MPRSRAPTLSPACPWSSSLRNISTPVTTVFCVSRKPMISTSSPTLTMPRSMRPVATVPRPLIENTSSIAIRNGLSSARTGSGMYVSQRVEQLLDRRRPSSPVSPLSAGSAEPRMIGVSSPGNLYFVEQLADFHLDQVEQLLVGVADHVALVQEDDDRRHADLARRAGRARASAASGRRARAHEDRAVHLRGARDHVLDVVGVARGNRRARSGASPTRTRRAPSRS